MGQRIPCGGTTYNAELGEYRDLICGCVFRLAPELDFICLKVTKTQPRRKMIYSQSPKIHSTPDEGDSDNSNADDFNNPMLKVPPRRQEAKEDEEEAEEGSGGGKSQSNVRHLLDQGRFG